MAFTLPSVEGMSTLRASGPGASKVRDDHSTPSPQHINRLVFVVHVFLSLQYYIDGVFVVIIG